MSFKNQTAEIHREEGVHHHPHYRQYHGNDFARDGDRHNRAPQSGGLERAPHKCVAVGAHRGVHRVLQVVEHQRREVSGEEQNAHIAHKQSRDAVGGDVLQHYHQGQRPACQRYEANEVERLLGHGDMVGVDNVEKRNGEEQVEPAPANVAPPFGAGRKRQFQKEIGNEHPAHHQLKTHIVGVLQKGNIVERVVGDKHNQRHRERQHHKMGHIQRGFRRRLHARRHRGSHLPPDGAGSCRQSLKSLFQSHIISTTPCAVPRL